MGPFMSSQETNRKSLFGLFPKSPPKPEQHPSSASHTQPMLQDVEEAAAVETPPSYQYISSWQKSADAEQTESQREVVVNAAGMASKLDEILKAPQPANTENTLDEPRCISTQAADRFSAALDLEERAAPPSPPAEHVSPASIPAPNAAKRFAERLTQRVEGALQQPVPTTTYSEAE